MSRGHPTPPAKNRLPYVEPRPPRRCSICNDRISEVYGATYERSLCRPHLQRACEHEFVDTIFTFRVCQFCEIPEGAEPLPLENGA